MWYRRNSTPLPNYGCMGVTMIYEGTVLKSPPQRMKNNPLRPIDRNVNNCHWILIKLTEMHCNSVVHIVVSKHHSYCEIWVRWVYIYIYIYIAWEMALDIGVAYWYDDVMTWKRCLCYRPFMKGIHRLPVDTQCWCIFVAGLKKVLNKHSSWL